MPEPKTVNLATDRPLPHWVAISGTQARELRDLAKTLAAKLAPVLKPGDLPTPKEIVADESESPALGGIVKVCAENDDTIELLRHLIANQRVS